MSSIFHEIRTACEQIADGSRWVRIDFEKLVVYPELLQIARMDPLVHSAEHHLLDMGEDTLIFFLLLDTVNFGSGYFPFLDKDKGVSGYFTVAGRLKAYCAAHGVPQPLTLSSITPTQCAKIFCQDLSNRHAEELMFFFATAWNQLGHWVLERWGGDYLGFLRAAKSAEQVVGYLNELSYFADVSHYGVVRVPFMKRAQIFLHDINIALPKHPLANFDDLDRLTVFADNLIPYVLRSDGILKCDAWLAHRIESEQLVGAGSTEEIELRACSVHASEILVQLLSEMGAAVSARQVDYHLWNRGQMLKKHSPLKRHRTRTVFY